MPAPSGLRSLWADRLSAASMSQNVAEIDIAPACRPNSRHIGTTTFTAGRFKCRPTTPVATAAARVTMHRGGLSATPRCQRDVVFDRDGLKAGRADVHADPFEQSHHGEVVARDERGEVGDALLVRAVSQATQQFSAQSSTLPVVDDGDGNLGD